jgi:hypothetical protein
MPCTHVSVCPSPGEMRQAVCCKERPLYNDSDGIGRCLLYHSIKVAFSAREALYFVAVHESGNRPIHSLKGNEHLRRERTRLNFASNLHDLSNGECCHTSPLPCSMPKLHRLRPATISGCGAATPNPNSTYHMRRASGAPFSPSVSGIQRKIFDADRLHALKEEDR